MTKLLLFFVYKPCTTKFTLQKSFSKLAFYILQIMKKTSPIFVRYWFLLIGYNNPSPSDTVLANERKVFSVKWNRISVQRLMLHVNRWWKSPAGNSGYYWWVFLKANDFNILYLFPRTRVETEKIMSLTFELVFFILFPWLP